MTKHTSRDDVWNEALLLATNEESFSIEDIASSEDVDTSERTVRDTLNTLVDFGWLSKEKDRGHTFQPGPLALGEEPNPNATPIDSIERSSDLSKDEVYFGTVDKVAEDGNAIIELPKGYINLGPIDESAVGESVRFKRVESTWGFCMDEEYTYDGYSPKDGSSAPPSQSESSPDEDRPRLATPIDDIESVSELSEGEVYFGTVDGITRSDNAIIELPKGHVNLGPIDDSAVGEDVRFEKADGVWGECIDEEYTYDGYSPGPSSQSSSSSSSPSSKLSKKPWIETPRNKNELLSGHQ
jgi:hypothetical protein